MKRRMLFVLLACTVTVCANATDFGVFMENINSNWAARNYEGMKNVITNRLVNITNDLPALIAKADYYTTIELNMVEASNAVCVIKSLTNSLSWEGNEWEAGVLEAIVVSVESPEQSMQDGCVFGLSPAELEQAHQEFPTNHPLTIFLPRYAIIQYESDD